LEHYGYWPAYSPGALPRPDPAVFRDRICKEAQQA